ncbi:MAG: MATE family efflux transporter [Bacteroidota bacterium]
MSNHSAALGTEKIGKLLLQQSVPAGIGILVMSINMIVDTIFVGNWIGPLAIAAITVVLPIVFLIASVGMAIGVGGGSMISRALGADDERRANNVFGNQIAMAMTLAIGFLILAYFLGGPILTAFGANGKIMGLAEVYFYGLLPAVPFLAFAMMSNNVIRAEGHPRIAMMVMLIPALANIGLDILFINVFEWGMAGAAWASGLSFMASAVYSLLYFLFGKSELRIRARDFPLKWELVKEILALGGVTLARQGVVSILAIVLNNVLYQYGNEDYVAMYGIINRMMMFALFPILGLTQGFLPITGYNFGAKHFERVRKTLQVSIVAGTILSLVIYLGLVVFRRPLVGLFTDESFYMDHTPRAMLIVFAATPIVLTQFVGAAYFQAIGRALPALLLTLTKQGFFLVPLCLLFPVWFGVEGIWWAFPVADTMSTVVTLFFLRRAMQDLQVMEIEAHPEKAPHPEATPVEAESEA